MTDVQNGVIKALPIQLAVKLTVSHHQQNKKNFSAN